MSLGFFLAPTSHFLTFVKIIPILKFSTDLFVLTGKQIVNLGCSLRSVVMKAVGQGPYNYEAQIQASWWMQ